VYKNFAEPNQPAGGGSEVRAYLGETSPARRAEIEALVARYPDMSPEDLAALLRWYRREASSMDVALVASNERVRPQFEAFMRDHIAPYNWKEKAITVALSAGVAGLFAFGLMADVS
jgi:hypothetical protein